MDQVERAGAYAGILKFVVERIRIVNGFLEQDKISMAKTYLATIIMVLNDEKFVRELEAS
jgi:hypothetical protein